MFVYRNLMSILVFAVCVGCNMSLIGFEDGKAFVELKDIVGKDHQ